MQKQNQALRTLSLVTGIIGLVIALVVFINLRFAYWWGIVLFVGLAELAIGVLELVAGNMASKGKNWIFLLISSILGIAAFFPTALASVIMLVMHRQSFQTGSDAKI